MQALRQQDCSHLISAERNDEDSGSCLVMDALAAIRKHLGMEVAFVAEFSSGHRHFRFVDATADPPPITIGDSHPLEETYCQRVVDGRLPGLITDAWEIPSALELPITTELPVRAHLSVPIRFSNGQIYGTFCCFSTNPDPILDDRDMAMVRSFADLTSRHLERIATAEAARNQVIKKIKNIINTEAFSTVYQPIYDFRVNRIVSFESLTRFSLQSYQDPDVIFEEAGRVGLGEELETATTSKALRILDVLPENYCLFINVSPQEIIDRILHKLLDNLPLKRIVVEVTEKMAVSDYIALRDALAPLRQFGLRFAISNAGAGFASLQHIVELGPNIIKLDTTLTRHIDVNPKLRALAVSMISFAQHTGAIVIAEGVETIKELETLRQLGISKAQGYLLGEPMIMSDVLDLISYTNKYSKDQE